MFLPAIIPIIIFCNLLYHMNPCHYRIKFMRCVLNLHLTVCFRCTVAHCCNPQFSGPQFKIFHHLKLNINYPPFITSVFTFSSWFPKFSSHSLTPAEIQCTQREKASQVLSTQSLSTQVPATAYTINLNSVTMTERGKKVT